ncbi:MAG: DUF5721 family protein [Candidatus Limivivens sp.]|nr:DUF5721 family protein [Candidatus Limivivens sp.]
MQAYQIPDVKGFMGKLLLTSTFDHFLLSEAVITTFNVFSIDGHFHNEYFSDLNTEPTDQTLSRWEQVRPFCFSLIKGKYTPLNLKIIFQLSEKNVERLLLQSGISLNPSDVEGLYLNIRYDGATLSCITGTSLKLFTLDKTLEHTWDQMVGAFLKQKEIPYEMR